MLKKDIIIPFTDFFFKSYFPLQHIGLFYNVYIKPHFEYWCVILGSSVNSQVHTIEKNTEKGLKTDI